MFLRLLPLRKLLGLGPWRPLLRRVVARSLEAPVPILMQLTTGVIIHLVLQRQLLRLLASGVLLVLAMFLRRLRWPLAAIGWRNGRRKRS